MEAQAEAQAEVQAFASARGADVPISPWGAPARFCNDYAEGTVSFVHRPPQGSARPLAHAEILEISGPPESAWELQVQARFKTVPQGTIWCGFELRDGPMQLGVLARGFARGLLKVVTSKAQQRGAELRYALGDEGDGARPHIAVPLMEASRMFRSSGEVPLPVTHRGKKGTWHWSGRDWEPIDRSAKDFLDGEHCYTFVFNTNYLDWHDWTVVGIPYMKSLDLGMFWGTQNCNAVIYDDAGPSGGRRTFFEMALLPPQARSRATDPCDRKLSEGSLADSTKDSLPEFSPRLSNGTTTPGTIEDDEEWSFDGVSEEGGAMRGTSRKPGQNAPGPSQNTGALRLSNGTTTPGASEDDEEGSLGGVSEEGGATRGTSRKPSQNAPGPSQSTGALRPPSIEATAAPEASWCGLGVFCWP